ncbi:hypothetical protein AB0D86_20885 [Streptomyces sp. NPDC048324]|uniref:hypothetical protein n=1 Tax=Streptomyces sp. NPDC048324 TaxID=3157205 RepID=UPI00343FE5AD
MTVGPPGTGTREKDREDSDARVIAPNQKDAKGRVGVAVTYDDPTLPKGSAGFGGYFVFDPVTYRFLGFRDTRTSGDGAARKTYTQLSYLDSWAVVDKVKQRP